MPAVIFALWLLVMLALDFWDGYREGPRPTRIKAAYTLLLLLTLYQALLTFARLRWPGFYELAALLFRALGTLVSRSLGWKG